MRKFKNSWALRENNPVLLNLVTALRKALRINQQSLPTRQIKSKPNSIKFEFNWRKCGSNHPKCEPLTQEVRRV